MSADREHPIWRQHGEKVPRKRSRKPVAHGESQVWVCDFVYDACANCQQLKRLTFTDEYTRECLAIDIAGSIRSSRVIEALSRLVSTRGAPRHLRSDNGPQFVSSAVLRWLMHANIDIPRACAAGSSHTELAMVQNRIDAKILINTFRREYKDIRSYSSLGELLSDPVSADPINNKFDCHMLLRKEAGRVGPAVTKF